jgi:hypothetical protein
MLCREVSLVLVCPRSKHMRNNCLPPQNATRHMEVRFGGHGNRKVGICGEQGPCFRLAGDLRCRTCIDDA